MFLVLSWRWDKEEILRPHKESNLRTLDFSAPYIFTEYKTYHLSLLTLLILAICWMHVICELCNRPCSPWSLCGSVIKHQNMKKSEGLRSWGPRNVLYQAQNLPSILLCCWCHWSEQYAGYVLFMNFVMGLAHHGVSVAQWKSIRAWKNPKVWGHGDPEIFLCLTLMTRQKTPFSISVPNSKTYHLSYSIKSYLAKL